MEKEIANIEIALQQPEKATDSAFLLLTVKETGIRTKCMNRGNSYRGSR